MDIRLQFLMLQGLRCLLENDSKSIESKKIASHIERYLQSIDRRTGDLPENATRLPFYQIIEIRDEEWEVRLNAGFESSFTTSKKLAHEKAYQKLRKLQEKVEKALVEVQEAVADM